MAFRMRKQVRYTRACKRRTRTFDKFFSFGGNLADQFMFFLMFSFIVAITVSRSVGGKFLRICFFNFVYPGKQTVQYKDFLSFK